VGTIAASCNSFPLRFTPYTIEELKSRLPLIISFQIHNNNYNNNNNLSSQDIEKENTKNNNEITIFIQQTTERQGAQEDVGFFLWPSSVYFSSIYSIQSR